jgi:enoyl-CoA hydratase/carnithine racemase
LDYSVAHQWLQLVEKINRKPMMQMLLTGEPIKANFAKEIGLINDCYSKLRLNKEVLKIAKKIASKSNLTIKIGKEAFYKQLEMPLRKAYAYTSQNDDKKYDGNGC